jgi:hypothetical protein
MDQCRGCDSVRLIAPDLFDSDACRKARQGATADDREESTITDGKPHYFQLRDKTKRTFLTNDDVFS